MIVGHPSWWWVTPDTVGVPRGGRYGEVDWFEEEAGKQGLYIAWSKLWKCFFVYSRRPDGWPIPQIGCLKWDTMIPQPLNRQYLNELLWHWDRHSRVKYATLKASMERSEREWREKVAAEMYAEINEMARDATEETMRATGYKTRPLISIPKIVKVGGSC